MNTQNTRNHNTLILICLLFTACEKNIEINYKENQSSIVIDANLTDQDEPYTLKITKSIPLSSTDKNPTVDNAKVVINNDAGNTEILNPMGNGLYRSTTFKGNLGSLYTLSIEIESQKYVAQSIMQAKVKFDDIKIEAVTFGGDTEYNIIPIFNDPITKGNNYRFVLSVNGKLINQQLVLNDEVKNGVANTQKLELNDGDLKLKSGDLISLEMQCIDKNVSTYYTTLALIANSGPGGGTTPNNPPSNISNGALGLFSAHTVEVKQVIIP